MRTNISLKAILLLFLVLFAIPTFQIINIAHSIQPQKSSTRSYGGFQERNELRTAKALGWLKNWVICLKRVLGIPV